MWCLKISNTGGLRPLKGLLKQVFFLPPRCILTHVFSPWPRPLWIIAILLCQHMYHRITGWWRREIKPTHCCNVPLELIPEEEDGAPCALYRGPIVKKKKNTDCFSSVTHLCALLACQLTHTKYEKWRLAIPGGPTFYMFYRRGFTGMTASLIFSTS